MVNSSYNIQVGLLIKEIPEVAKEQFFALHRGTAINLFHNEMPRLSVDIDLTYIPLEDRQTSLKNINDALSRIKKSIERNLKSVTVEHRSEISKLLISTKNAQIKIEVNETKRGLIEKPEIKILCKKAQDKFDSFCAISVVDVGQLYGGKICAALDRQHPRDLFDIKYFLENKTVDRNIIQGFIFCLIGSDRPMNEIIQPNLLNQEKALSNQFEGMSDVEFSYKDFEETRLKLITLIKENLTSADKEFLMSIKNAEPDWSIYDFKNYPSVEWKLMNVQNLKRSNPKKHQNQLELLKERLNI